MEYPGVSDRIKVVFADTFIIIALSAFLAYFISELDIEYPYTNIVAFICLFYLYDPLLTSLFGGTLGHKTIGLRVVQENNPSKKLSFPFALIRFFLKSIFGIISILVVATNEKGKSIHDYLSGSIVIYETRKK